MEPKRLEKRRRTSPQSGNPRYGPGPTTSTRGGQAADQPSSRRSGAPIDASSLSDRELQEATTGFAGLSMPAYAPPSSGTPAWEPPSHASYYQPQTPLPSSQHEQYGAYSTSQLGQYSAYLSNQPGQDLAYPSNQPGQYLAYPSNQPGQYSAYLSNQPGQYSAYPSNQPGQYSAYLSNQPGQHNAHQSEQAPLYQKPIAPNPYSNNPPATGMGTASGAPVGHQPETRDPTKSSLATAPQSSLREEIRRRQRQQQDRHWEDAEDEELVYLIEQYDNKRVNWRDIAKALSTKFKQKITPNDCERRWDHKQRKAKSDSFGWSREEDEELVDLRGQYDSYSNMWAILAHGMYRAGFTNRATEDYEKRWNDVLKARNQNFKPKDWSKEEDIWLTELVKNFDKWNTQNGWEQISDQMRAAGSRRAPESCRIRWQETLRGPADFGAWTEDEVKLLDGFDLQCSPVEIVDLLERHLGSIRSVAQCRHKLDSLRKGPGSQESTVNWSPDADQKLFNFNKGKKRVSHKDAAEELNRAFRTDIFTPGECDKRWRMIKSTMQQRG